MERIIKKIFITAVIRLETGLHIGDNRESVEIGGVDNPIIKRKDNKQPYLPGSSIKGKIRCLLEQVRGENLDGSSKNNGKIVASLFGGGENRQTGLSSTPSKIIVRDAYLTPNWATELARFTDNLFTEVKWENRIDRIKGVAEHPRQQERIPAGAEFELNFILNIWEGAPFSEKDYVKTFLEGLELLENDYLGGSGTRGYGQISFVELRKFEKEYKLEKDEITIEKSPEVPTQNLAEFKKQTVELQSA